MDEATFVAAARADCVASDPDDAEERDGGFSYYRLASALQEGDLATVMALKGKLAGGYHRDFQLLKAPLWRGVDRTEPGRRRATPHRRRRRQSWPWVQAGTSA